MLLVSFNGLNFQITLKAMKSIIDLNHTASDNELEKHRELKLLDPSYGYSGVYTCVAETLSEEKTHSKNVIFYSKNFFKII